MKEVYHTEVKRYYPPCPRVGVGALVRHENKIVLVKRGQKPAKGEWSLPGGLVELGETLVEAIHREVFEECSIYIDLKDQLDTFEFIEKDNENSIKYHYIVLDFWATLKSGRLSAGSDVEDARWFTADEIDQLKCSDAIKMLAQQVLQKHEY